ncbi:MAG: Hpt domain-containing protein [Treponema sp.]|nr:Hpt domain-containing protein [Treponema sp.]
MNQINCQTGNDELRQKLIKSFVKNHRDVYKKINDAIDTGDIQLAYMLTHTLKSNAGQLNKPSLQQAASEAENNLAGGKNLVTARQMEHLKKEIDFVLAEFIPLIREPARPVQAAPLSDDEALEVLEKLSALLEEGNSECLSFTDKLSMIPGCEELIQMIEDFDFQPAFEALQVMFNSGLRKEG